jgi:hypothetical protein
LRRTVQRLLRGLFSSLRNSVTVPKSGWNEREEPSDGSAQARSVLDEPLDGSAQARSVLDEPFDGLLTCWNLIGPTAIDVVAEVDAAIGES